MFKKTPPKKTELDLATDRLFDELKAYPADAPEYKTRFKQLEKLHALKDLERPKPMDKAVLIAAGANLLGILAIVGHERANVVTSKALSFVMKSR